jgi:hypothetical protein
MMYYSLSSSHFVFFLVVVTQSAVIAPLFQTANSPSRVRDAVEIAYGDFDGGIVGSALKGALQKLYASGASVPKFNVVDATSSSPDQLTDEVRDTKYFGAIWVPAGTTAAMQGALLSPASPGYTPAQAIQWVWDEGRNPTMTAARVGAPLRIILGQFAAQFASNNIAALVTQGVNLTALAASNPSLLSGPIGHTETNLYPAATAVPIGVMAMTIGG